MGKLLDIIPYIDVPINELNNGIPIKYYKEITSKNKNINGTTANAKDATAIDTDFQP